MASPQASSSRREEGRVQLVVGLGRAFLVLLCAILLLASKSPHRLALAMLLGALVLVAAAASTVPSTGASARLATLVEAVLWAAAALLDPTPSGPLLPYLLAPALAGGLALGLEGVLVPIGTGAVATLAGVPVLSSDRERSELAGSTAQWIALALAVGLLAAWVHRLSTNTDPGYLEAYQLLGQLRSLARALPMGLDSAGIAEELLRGVQEHFPRLRSGAVYTRSPGNLPALRATTRTDRLNWRVDLSEDSVFTEAWSAQAPTTTSVDRQDGESTLVALPLVVANRTVGVIGLELPSGDYAALALQVDRLARELDQAALRLETAMLFDELREVATVEERRRLAREIHDGVAQDLAGFGYVLDGLAKDVLEGADPQVLSDAVLGVRRELTRLVTELRNSIFELRTEVDLHGGLGAALSEYVRGVGAATKLTVHLSLDERPDRLPSDAEAELLRIAQEAVTNARKHAQAANLWVRCDIDPPRALLVVEDDGVGPGEQRDGSFGLEIMRERAARLRAELTVRPREPQGTVVTCVLGPGA